MRTTIRKVKIAWSEVSYYAYRRAQCHLFDWNAFILIGET
jgi:hypothetical protein